MVAGFFTVEADDLRILIPASLSYGLLTLTVPLGVQVLVNRILSTALTSQALSVIVLVTIGLIAAAFLRVIQRKIVERIQRRFHSRMTLSAAESVFKDHEIKVSHLYYDTFIVQKSLSSLLMEGLGVAVQLLFALILLAFYHPLFLAFDFLIIVALVAVVGFPASHLINTAIDESKAKHDTANFLFELPNQHTKETFFNAADEAALNYLKVRLIHFKSLISQMIALSTLHIVSNALLLGFGAYFVIIHQMSLGQLVAAELVFSAAFLSVEKLNKHLESFFDMTAALDKLSKITNAVERADHET
ncbi:MAG: ABC transporter ATP-binding protein [Cryobacterium sp.]|nr:ABC transporter ATP-binding protein [Oligoflexia bacterium]